MIARVEVERVIAMTVDEVAFLRSHLLLTDRVWEWGAGWSTGYFAQFVARWTAVEHDRGWARELLPYLRPNTSLLYVPPDKPWDPASLEDGDGDTFHSYVRAYRGKWPDVVIVDGRARVACMAQVYDGSPIPRVVLLHDCERSEYADIWEDWDKVEQIGVLARIDRKTRLRPAKVA